MAGLPGHAIVGVSLMIPSLDDPLQAALSSARAFLADREITRLSPWGNGHIHLTFKVETPEGGFLLQGLNERVFPEVNAVIDNIARISRHLACRQNHGPDGDRQRLRPVTTPSQNVLHRDAGGKAWRMFHFIPGALSYDTAQNLRQIEKAAQAFGRFQRALDDLPGPPLHETIPGFHDTRRRFTRFEQLLQTAPQEKRSTCEKEIQVLRGQRHLAKALQDLALPLRTVHNDTKLNNLLFDQPGLEPLCVIDWDTVMPGLVAHDFGDMIRTMASEAAEDEPDLTRVQLSPERIRAIRAGYLSATRDWLTQAEVETLMLGAQTILFEQATRFLTDHLEGDLYYPVSHPGHNLERARVQLTLLDQLRQLPCPSLLTCPSGQE